MKILFIILVYCSFSFLAFSKTLWTTGSNSNGQLGGGTENDGFRSKWIMISQDTNWSIISSGGEHTCAIKEDGSLWAWGSGGWGQLGNSSTYSYFIPQRIGTENDWISVKCGFNYAIAQKNGW